MVFVAGGQRFAIRPAELGVEPDWKAAVDAAQRQGDGFGPIRGFRRLDVQVFGADVTPPTRVLNGALEYKLGLLAGKVNRAPRDAAVVRRGLNIVVVPARAGPRARPRTPPSARSCRSLASIDRTSAHVELPLRVQQPRVRAAALARAARQARVALSAPVRLQLGKTRWLLPPRRIARLLELPAGGRTTLEDRRPRRRRVARPASASASRSPRRTRPSPSTARASASCRRSRASASTRSAPPTPCCSAALKRRPELRVARLPVQESQAKLSTEAARAMHITALGLELHDASTAASRIASTTSSSSRTSSTAS